MTPTPPYRRFVVISGAATIGPVLRKGDEGQSHHDLFVVAAGKDWATRLNETACGWLIGERPPFEVSIAVYSGPSLSDDETRRSLERWARANDEITFTTHIHERRQPEGE